MDGFKAEIGLGLAALGRLGYINFGHAGDIADAGVERVDVDEHEVSDLSADQLRRQRDETSELLGAHLRLYQIHSATLDSGTIERALETGGFDAVQATWNLHERAATLALALAHEAGLRVYVKEVLANGRLTASA